MNIRKNYYIREKLILYSYQNNKLLGTLTSGLLSISSKRNLELKQQQQQNKTNTLKKTQWQTPEGKLKQIYQFKIYLKASK